MRGWCVRVVGRVHHTTALREHVSRLNAFCHLRHPRHTGMSELQFTNRHCGSVRVETMPTALTPTTVDVRAADIVPVTEFNDL
jgi:hypothetical protein